MTILYWLIGIACVGIVCYFMSEEIIKDDAKELAENPDLAYKEWLKAKEEENENNDYNNSDYITDPSYSYLAVNIYNDD